MLAVLSAALADSTIVQLDYKICSWVCLMFFALQLDRGNINQANSDNMLADLGLSTDQYNYGMTIFYLCFLCAELPSQMISKKLGPDVWIPIQMVSWSIIAICQCLIKEEKGFYATRALLGLIEGGMSQIKHRYEQSQLCLHLIVARFYPRCDSLPVLLLYEQGASNPAELLLLRFPPYPSHCCLPCIWHTPLAWRWRMGRLEMAVCSRRRSDGIDRSVLVVLSSTKSYADGQLVPWQRWLVQ